MTRGDEELEREGGFTLVELLITIVILGVIMFPLGNMVLLYFENTVDTQARASVSHDEQIAAAYFSSDVASMGRHNSDGSAKQSVWTSLTGAPINCGTGIAPFLVLAWDEVTSSGTTTGEAVYGTRSQVDNGQTETQLVRMHCAASGTPDATAVLAHDLTGTPTVTCDTTCTSSTVLPSVVSVALSLRSPGDTGSPQQMTLSGERRQS